MPKSMTGYGRTEQIVEGISVTAELKSVNHRYFELSARLPRNYGFLEEKIKALLQDRISRGKVDVFIGLDSGETGETVVSINHSLAEATVSALCELCDQYGVRDDISAGLLSRNSDILSVRRLPPDEDFVWRVTEQALFTALDNFMAMRGAEGERLKSDILSRLEFIEEAARIVQQKAPETVKAYREKLYDKMKELLDNKQIDESRLLTESAVFADKIATDEETVRLHSHISQFREMLTLDEPIGRKLDFLLQEMNREANTIGSKAQDIEISRIVIDIKAELEKIREQIQNIE